MTDYIQKWEQIAVNIVDRIDGFCDKVCLCKAKLCLIMASKLIVLDQKLFRKMIAIASEIIELEERQGNEVVSDLWEGI